eukprot:CFRG4186T1
MALVFGSWTGGGVKYPGLHKQKRATQLDKRGDTSSPKVRSLVRENEDGVGHNSSKQSLNLEDFDDSNLFEDLKSDFQGARLLDDSAYMSPSLEKNVVRRSRGLSTNRDPAVPPTYTLYRSEEQTTEDKQGSQLPIAYPSRKKYNIALSSSVAKASSTIHVATTDPLVRSKYFKASDLSCPRDFRLRSTLQGGLNRDVHESTQNSNIRGGSSSLPSLRNVKCGNNDSTEALSRSNEDEHFLCEQARLQQLIDEDDGIEHKHVSYSTLIGATHRETQQFDRCMSCGSNPDPMCNHTISEIDYFVSAADPGRNDEFNLRFEKACATAPNARNRQIYKQASYIYNSNHVDDLVDYDEAMEFYQL